MDQTWVKTYMLPLLFDHVQKVSVVHNPVKNRTKCEAIVPTERGGETDDRYAVLGRRGGRRIQNIIFRAFYGMRTLDSRVEVRKNMAIGGCSGVVCLIDDDNLQPCRIKFLQSRSPEQCLVCRDGAGNALYQYRGLDKSKCHAHVSEPRGSVTRPLFDFYCPVGEEFPCLIRRLSSEFNAVDDDQGASCLGVSGQRLQPFQKRHEDDGFSSSGRERDPDLRGTVLERV